MKKWHMAVEIVVFSAGSGPLARESSHISLPVPRAAGELQCIVLPLTVSPITVHSNPPTLNPKTLKLKPWSSKALNYAL